MSHRSRRLAPVALALSLAACGATPPGTTRCTTPPPASATHAHASEVHAMPPAESPTESITPERAVERLFTAPGARAAWFTERFASQVPPARIDQLVAQLRTSLGDFRGVRRVDGAFETVFARGVVPTEVVLDGAGRISGLLFRPPRPNASTVEQALAELRALPGRVSVLALADGATERAALDADAPLAVGSSFKLAILAALRAQVDARHRAWTDVVPLDASARSLPSGFLQHWPAGAPLTLYSLAALMISQSDNTATDALLALAGRDAVERLAPRNRPFLATREAFVLKAPAQRALLERFRAGDERERRAVLAEVAARPLPTVAELGDGMIAPDVEWHFTARELCALMARVQDLPFVSINPGVADAHAWTRVAYKGGSEPGVLNTTTWLDAGSGHTFCVTATWNADRPLEELRFFTAYGALLTALRAEVPAAAAR